MKGREACGEEGLKNRGVGEVVVDGASDGENRFGLGGV